METTAINHRQLSIWKCRKWKSSWPSQNLDRISFKDIGKFQTTTFSDRINNIKEIHEEEHGFLSDEKIILRNDGDSTHSLSELKDAQLNGKDEDSDPIASNASTKGRKQHDRKALMREIYLLLHSASLDDTPQIASYLKTYEVPMAPDCTHFHICRKTFWQACSKWWKFPGWKSLSTTFIQTTRNHL